MRRDIPRLEKEKQINSRISAEIESVESSLRLFKENIKGIDYLSDDVNDDSKTVESNAPDIHEQTTLMANALKQALAPLTMRMDEKLAIDSSTDQSGKLIVNSLNRLNKIFDDYD